MKVKLFALAAVLLLLVACEPSRDQLRADVDAAEAKLYGDKENYKFDEDLAQQTVDAYDSFVAAYPEDSLSPVYLFKSAELKKALRDFEGAIADYETLANKYPEAEKAPHGVFLQGFIYENELGDFEQARVRYEAFLAKYPDHELADDVQFSLTHLGKSADDILREFEMKAKAEAEAAANSEGEPQ